MNLVGNTFFRGLPRPARGFAAFAILSSVIAARKMFAACADGMMDMKRLATVFSSSACFSFQNLKVVITIDPLFLPSEGYHNDSFSLVAYSSCTTLLLST